MVAGTIDARTDSHLSHTPLLLDEEGWKEITSLLADTLSRAIEIQEEVGRPPRRRERPTPIATTLAILHFERLRRQEVTRSRVTGHGPRSALVTRSQRPQPSTNR